jgi:flagellar basal-body rod modification protein FlgD
MQVQNTTSNQPSGVFAADIGSTANSSASTATTSSTTAATEDTFLQLMVAELKNQDPTQPTDPTAFLTQLAQFSQLDQLIAINQKLAPQAPNSSTGSNSVAASTGVQAA